MKYNNLLVAVDGSESSLNALKAAFRSSAQRVNVVTVAPYYEGDLRLVGVHDIQGLLVEPCQSALSQAQEMAEAAGVFISTECAVGEPHERIVDLAEGENCDLIVMGSKGHSLLERVLLGSVTRRVIGYSRRDVLVVPPHTDIGWERILVADDGSPTSQAAVARAMAVAQAYGGELKVVSVLEVPAQVAREGLELMEGWRNRLIDYVRGITAQAESLGLKAEGLVRGGEPYRIICELAREQQANLIVIGSHGRTGLKRLLMGSVAEKVIGHAPCPVLVVRT